MRRNQVVYPVDPTVLESYPDPTASLQAITQLLSWFDRARPVHPRGGDGMYNRTRLCRAGRGVHSVGEAAAGLRLALRLQRWDAAISVVRLARIYRT